jgi:hypothetical protein
MAEFMYLYRVPAGSSHTPDSPQQMQQRFENWTAWFKNLEAKGHLKQMGHPLASTGAVVKDARGTVHDGPYAESKDIVIGYTLVEAEDVAQASRLTAGCPVFDGGGAVEVRPIRQM